MLQKLYIFPSEVEATTAEAALGQAAAVDVVGKTYSEVPEGEEPVELPGWFVLTVWNGQPPEELAEFEASPDLAPRKFAGVPFEQPPVTPAVPRSVTPLQARKALRAAGLIDAVDAYLATQPAEIREAWEYAVEVRRDDQSVVAMTAAALGMTSAQMDQLFILASGFNS